MFHGSIHYYEARKDEDISRRAPSLMCIHFAKAFFLYAVLQHLEIWKVVQQSAYC